MHEKCTKTDKNKHVFDIRGVTSAKNCVFFVCFCAFGVYLTFSPIMNYICDVDE